MYKPRKPSAHKLIRIAYKKLYEARVFARLGYPILAAKEEKIAKELFILAGFKAHKRRR